MSKVEDQRPATVAKLAGILVRQAEKEGSASLSLRGDKVLYLRTRNEHPVFYDAYVGGDLVRSGMLIGTARQFVHGVLVGSLLS